MNRRANEVTSDQLVNEFNNVISETEQLMHSVASAGGEKAASLRASMEQNLAGAKERLRGYQQAAADKAKAAAEATDEYVRENPWKAVGVAAGVPLLVGLVLAVLLSRR